MMQIVSGGMDCPMAEAVSYTRTEVYTLAISQKGFRMDKEGL